MKATKVTRTRRKSLAKEAVQLTVEGKESRIHFIPTPQGTIAKIQSFTKNPNLINFGTYQIGGKTMKMYAFRNNKKLVFLRINDSFIPINKIGMRSTLSLIMRAGRFLGLLGKKKLKKASLGKKRFRKSHRNVANNTVYNKL
jgi:hypothetical protein